jgi:hypothetical protein
MCYSTVTTVLVDWSILFPLYRMEDRHLPVGSSEIQELGALVRRFVAISRHVDQVGVDEERYVSFYAAKSRIVCVRHVL